MKITAARKAAAIALGATMVLTLATSSVFAGKGVGAFNGNKYGTENKNATQLCPDGYTLTWDSYDGADLNGNDWVCKKWSGNEGVYSSIDDITQTTKWD
jgi:hypothetical protein